MVSRFATARCDVGRAIRAVAVVQGALTLIAFAMLLLVFARTDLSVALVFENSHSAKPFIYKIAGAWGNHEGSMLLWVTVLSASGACSRRCCRGASSERTLVAALGAQAALALGFYAFLLVASNPFARLDPAPAGGQGLNPLLQDPGLAFHPPTLYLGYVGLSVAFSLAVGALLTGEVDRAARAGDAALGARGLDPADARHHGRELLGLLRAWLGRLVVLGPGRECLADAVARGHGAAPFDQRAGRARSALKAWTMMLAVIAFSMSMVGTFLVRSGILTSVHAFAIDPERGTFLLALLAIYVGAAFILFAVRGATLKEGAPFELVSRESGPGRQQSAAQRHPGHRLHRHALSAVRRSDQRREAFGRRALFQRGCRAAGADARDAGRHRAAAQLAARTAARLQASLHVPALLGGHGLAQSAFIRCAGHARPSAPRPALAAGLIPRRSILPLVGRNPVARAARDLGHGRRASRALRSRSPAWRPNAALHAGDASPSREPARRSASGPGPSSSKASRPAAGQNWTAIEAELRATRGSGIHVLKPQTRYFTDPPTETNEAAIETFWNGQLYTVIGKPDARALAAAVVVEALRHPDLGRRRADRAWRSVRADRPRSAAAPAYAGMAQGALRMSRAFRFAAARASVLIVAALVWRLATPADTTVSLAS